MFILYYFAKIQNNFESTKYLSIFFQKYFLEEFDEKDPFLLTAAINLIEIDSGSHRDG